VVVELNINVELNGDIDVRDREARLSLVTAEGSGLLLVDLVLDALRSKGTTCEMIPLAEGVRAFPTTREVKVTIVEVGIAVLQVFPVESTLLLVATLVVVVLWRVEWIAVHVPCRSCLAEEACSEHNLRDLHIDECKSIRLYACGIKDQMVVNVVSV
jgi:hypothetical protein